MTFTIKTIKMQTVDSCRYVDFHGSFIMKEISLAWKETISSIILLRVIFIYQYIEFIHYKMFRKN